MSPQSTSPPPSPQSCFSSSSSSSSEDMESIRPSSPREPGPWLWECAECGEIYQMSATTRCLLCGIWVYEEGQEFRLLGYHFDKVGWKAQRASARNMRALPAEMERGRPDDEIKETEETGETEEDVEKGSEVFEDVPGTEHNCFLECEYPGYCYDEGKRVPSRFQTAARRKSGLRV